MTCSALATSATQLLVMRAALGIAEAAYIPAAIALIADHHGPDTRARAMGIHLAGFSVGMVGGGSLAGYLGDRFGWRPSFVILGVLMVLGGVPPLSQLNRSTTSFADWLLGELSYAWPNTAHQNQRLSFSR